MERLSPEQLRKEQQATLAGRRMNYWWVLRPLFILMDLIYGRKKTLSKFKVLEVIARVPYQAWDHVAFIAITHTFKSPDFARRIHDRIRENREANDNEKWHLFILQELIQRQGAKEGYVKFWLIPQILAFTYYHIVWLMYVIRPAWSYRMNAEFEDHAEHEYMEFVAEHPELEAEPFESIFKEDFGGQFETLADVFRQIGYDERVHKLESLARMPVARFA